MPSHEGQVRSHDDTDESDDDDSGYGSGDDSDHDSLSKGTEEPGSLRNGHMLDTLNTRT